MNATTMDRRIKALEVKGMGNERPVLLIVRRLVSAEGGHDPVGISAAPPHFPDPVAGLPGESWEAFTGRLLGMLSHLQSGEVLRVFSGGAEL